MVYRLDLGTGAPVIVCRDAAQALALARVFVALATGRPAVFSSEVQETIIPPENPPDREQ